MPASRFRPLLIPVQPTRVRRNYRGGLQLDRLEGILSPADSHRPESWIGSTTPARNPGLTPEPNEGLTRIGPTGAAPETLAALLTAEPHFYLGEAHAAQLGPQLGFLAKLLDSAMRLHVQAHPTADFARTRLNSPFGKLEVYYVLAVRPGVAGQIWLGFQRPPEREEWRRIIESQDIAAMAACFDRIEVHPGEVWIVPGGLPHAIGAGVLMVEVMEPSDWVVRCEFEREGAVVPPDARFMGRNLDFCLDVFDYTRRSVSDVRAQCRLSPVPLSDGPGWSLEQLVGADRTRCFEIQRVRARRACTLPGTGRGTLVIQTRGSGTVLAGPEAAPLASGGVCFVAAAATELTLAPSEGTTDTEWILCRPAASA